MTTPMPKQDRAEVVDPLAAGEQALAAGDFTEALTHLQAAIAADPTDVSRQRLLVEAQLSAGDLSGARQTYAAIHAAGGADAALLVDLAHLYQLADDAAGARSAIEQAAQLAPDNSAIQLAQAQLYESQGDLAAAVPLYEALAAQYPTAATQLELARCLLALGRFRAADRAFRTLGRIDQDAELLARHGRIWCQVQLGDWRTALEQALGAARADRYDLTTALLAYARDRLFTRLPQEEITAREAALASRFQAVLQEQREVQAEQLVAIVAGEQGGIGRD